MTSTIKQKFRLNNGNVFSFREDSGSVSDKVPPAVYVVREHPFMGFFLEKVSDNLPLPAKIYGSAIPRRDRIMNTYEATDKSMTVGLFGSKGAGKTLLSNVIAQYALETKQIPVIDVSDSFMPSSSYLEFLDSLGETCIIFDEFLKHLGKMGDRSERSERDISKDRQDDMLRFFSGTNNTKRLTILIDNSKYHLSDLFTDRPSRIRYVYDYMGVEEEVVRNLAKDNGMSTEKADELATYALSNRTTFDVINEIVREWTMYPNDTLEEITKLMNVPTIGQKYLTKFAIQDCNVEGNEFLSEQKATLTNEIVEVDSFNNGSFRLKFTVPNPYKDVEIPEDEWYDHEASNSFNFRQYKRAKGKDVIEYDVSFSEECIVGMKNSVYAYQSNGVVVKMTRMDTVFKSSRKDYFTDF